jgi:hypothetical protein
MAEPGHQDVTLQTLHDDLTVGFGEMRVGFADLKATLVAGFAGLPSRESSEEMVRLLREGNRLQEARFAQLDVRIREQHLETQQVLHALVESHRILTGEVRTLAGEIRSLANEIRNLRSVVEVMSADIKALVARIDALIRGRGNGSPSA